MSKTKDHEFFLVLVELRFYFIQCIFRLQVGHCYALEWVLLFNFFCNVLSLLT
jgi:hypothetical protein